ncbi:hypothetical protein BBO99_00007827 [Phytophthora kernoviae]|uniref:Uncharacterized protein n=2 Tax=Phytophthora kernoviae TaxID=325452 RepID=A0A421GH41_9STRA|nr:hypothetical protein G195_009459 [Phytophthora kernoviae 00238/432]KAG2513511.1 hypothetical protein JM16_007934 [Phytophthora kernoviae]KAG2517216.1 hypothetical protein JM18_007848 [Phytophthora kernoviae]RLN26499.1 hypothetical protein BBI17_007795 [Phytophthora kernoviae]RLN76086.1 hypothetical protein BBO99_00007827 [Phytophthora kernoviae]
MKVVAPEEGMGALYKGWAPTAFGYRGAIYLAGSTSSEFFADMALCPMEMVEAMKANPETRFPFGSLVSLWSRQIPYITVKFFFFEKVVEVFYTHVFTEPKSSYPKSTQRSITFASGFPAGIICAIVLHSADSVVSLMSNPAYKDKRS